jgi:hypothetical protein
VKARQSIAVARLQYAGNWDPEPGGWRQLAALLHNRSRLDLATEPVKLGEGNLDVSRFKVAHLTGTAAFKLNEQQRAELRSFIAAGGTVFIDSAGGASTFADSAESELDALFAAPGTHAYKPLGNDHAVYTAAGDATSGPVGYRRFAQLALGKLKGPRLQGVQVGGRTAVFYSREDISVGLVGQPIDGIFGYDPATAANLAADIILFTGRAKGAKP